jgi:putative proteasome-type protease
VLEAVKLEPDAADDPATRRVACKPILDRVVTYSSSLADAAKCALLSFDPTMRSNLSVAPPIDLVCYRAGSLRADTHIDIADDDAYFDALRAAYSGGILELFQQLPDPAWIEAAEPGDN